MYSHAPSIKGSLRIASRTVREIEGAAVPRARSIDEILAKAGISEETRQWLAEAKARRAAKR
jgi:hypothetical protein